jgi:alpha-mannosidase
MDIGAYFDHGWNGLTQELKDARLVWTRGLANGVEGYANRLLNDSATALSGLIGKTGTNTRFFVFNALNWTRTDFADIPYAGPSPVHVVDLTSQAEVPSQRITLNGVSYLRVMAPNVPSVGYKVFEIRGGAGSTAFGDTIRADLPTKVIENEFYTITLGDNGSIASIVDRKRANREFVPAGTATTVNSFSAGLGSTAVDVENAGIVSKTFKIVSTAPPARTTRITLYRNSDRIDIRNEITQNFADLREWGFGFDIDSPTVRHDEIGVVLTAKLLPDGGHYSPRQARYDWLMANRFVDVSGASVGVTLSNPDLSFFKLGESSVTTLDTTRPLIRMLAGGRPDSDISSNGFVSQGGATNFLQRFALRTHGAYDQTAAMRFALEHQTPFVAQTVRGGTKYPATTFSQLKTNNTRVLLTGLKVAEDGMSRGVVARVWNSATTNSSFKFSGALALRQELTHIESFKRTPVAPMTLANQEMATFLLQ